VKIIDLSKLLKVSRKTVRKDSYELEAETLRNKIHGGAVLDKSSQESKYDRRFSEQERSKGWIAKKAIFYIEEEDSIYLDYGTTPYQLAKLLKNISNITAVTHIIPMIHLLLNYENIIVSGGVFKKVQGDYYSKCINECR